MAAWSRRGWWAALTLVPVLAIAAPSAGRAVTVHGGDHGDFGRVVFTVPQDMKFACAREGDHLTVGFTGGGHLPSLSPGPLNVPAVEGRDGSAALDLAPGAQPLIWRTRTMIVVDVYGAGMLPAGALGAPPTHDEAGPAKPVAGKQVDTSLVAAGTARSPDVRIVPPLPAAGPPPHSTATRFRAPAVPAGPPPAAFPPAAPLPARTPTALLPSSSLAISPNALAAIRLPSTAASPDPSILIPFGPDVGAAAFSRSGEAHVVFDEDKPVDLSALRDDPVFGGARITLLPEAAHLHLRLSPTAVLGLKRRDDGWMVSVIEHGAARTSPEMKLHDGVLDIALQGAGETVVLDDPVTGGRLLVGTVRTDGQAIATAHSSPEFALLPTWQGLLVDPLSDRLKLHAQAGGFSLRAAAGPPLVMLPTTAGGQISAASAALTRRFDFPDLPIEMLRRRLRSEQAVAALTPKLGRFAPRLRASQTMLALGMNREAAGLLRIAMQDDPAEAANLDATALVVIANWLDGVDFDDALANPALGTSDEITLWRSLLPTAAVVPAAEHLAAVWPLILAYPAPLARQLLPAAAAILARGHQLAALQSMLGRSIDPRLDPARADLLRSQGKIDAALAAYGRLIAGPDRKRSAEAARAALDIRLAAGRISPQAAADELLKHLYAWRDDGLELDTCLQIASLRARAGAWRQALAGLRETDARFPQAHDRVGIAKRQVITDLLQAGQAARLSPLDLAAMMEENADVLAERDASVTLAPVLVDKLVALDLPDRAAPIVARLMGQTAEGAAKAQLGWRLAELQLEQSDAPGALQSLAASAAGDLPQALAERRLVTQARALAESGDAPRALALLKTQTGIAAWTLEARLLEERHDWRGAEAVLASLASATLPASGRLDSAQQGLVLRQAGAASQAGDATALRRLRDAYLPRLAAGGPADLLRVLTQRPVQTIGELPRSDTEMGALRALPAALAALDRP